MHISSAGFGFESLDRDKLDRHVFFCILRDSESVWKAPSQRVSYRYEDCSGAIYIFFAFCRKPCRSCKLHISMKIY